jgi:hypothetical protein
MYTDAFLEDLEDLKDLEDLEVDFSDKYGIVFYENGEIVYKLNGYETIRENEYVIFDEHIRTLICKCVYAIIARGILVDRGKQPPAGGYKLSPFIHGSTEDILKATRTESILQKITGLQFYKNMENDSLRGWIINKNTFAINDIRDLFKFLGKIIDEEELNEIKNDS